MKDDLNLCIILMLCIIIATGIVVGGIILWSKSELWGVNKDLAEKVYSQRAEVCRLEREVFELKRICRWELVLNQVLPPQAKDEFDLLEAQAEQRKYASLQ